MLFVELSPRALRDLQALPKPYATAVFDDLEILKTPPWPGPPKVKRLQGTPYYRLRTGDFRSIFFQERQRVTILRVVNRKDLERVLKTLP